MNEPSTSYVAPLATTRHPDCRHQAGKRPAFAESAESSTLPPTRTAVAAAAVIGRLSGVSGRSGGCGSPRAPAPHAARPSGVASAVSTARAVGCHHRGSNFLWSRKEEECGQARASARAAEKRAHSPARVLDTLGDAATHHFGSRFVDAAASPAPRWRPPSSSLSSAIATARKGHPLCPRVAFRMRVSVPARVVSSDLRKVASFGGIFGNGGRGLPSWRASK